MYKKLLVAGSVIALMVSASAWAANEQLAISSAQYFPPPGAVNRDRGDDLTALLLDGNLGTASAITSAYTINAHGEQCVGFELSGLSEVTRLRMYKAPASGGLDMWVYYTTDTDSDLGQRSWQPVTGLTNGYGGTELITLNGTYGSISGNEIFAELHTGWLSVTFDPVYVTGIAIGFLMNEYIGAANNHVWIYEAEIYGETTSWASVPAPANWALGVSVDTDLSWMPGANLTDQSLYFGTDPDALTEVAAGDGTLATVANAALGGPLLFQTTYFWRVDGENTTESDSFPGTTWSFTTEGEPASSTGNQKVQISKAQYFPAPGSDNRDRGDDLTALLLDGDAGTGSAITAGFTTNANGEQCVGFDLSVPNDISRLRMYKAPEYGGCDIWVYYTTDTDADLGQRSWQPVTGLANGYEGTELITLDGTYGSISGNEIFAELHTGWFSVTFDPVHATGIAIGFLMNEYIGVEFLHVWLYEAELYGVKRGASVATPADGAIGVSVDTGLSWTPGANLTGQSLYFGLDPKVLLSQVASGHGTVAAVPYTTLGGPLRFNTKYFWRVDGENTTESGSFPGAIWSFTTSLGKAGNPTPADGDSVSDTSVTLSWTGEPGMVFDVYLGPDSRAMPRIEDDLADETTTVDSLADATEYFWRVDTYDAGGALVSQGNVWSFTADLETVEELWICVNPSPYDLNGDCKIDLADFTAFATQWLTCRREPEEHCH